MTLLAGVVTTVIACFPFVFTKLLDFVGLYGLLLSPAGAIVVTEHWIFPKLGLTRYWASRKKLRLNAPALIAWGAGMALALALNLSGTLHLFFLFLPVCILTSVLYILLAGRAGAKESAPPEESAPKETSESPAASDRFAPQERPERGLFYWISGAVALACLAA